VCSVFVQVCVFVCVSVCRYVSVRAHVSLCSTYQFELRQTNWDKLIKCAIHNKSIITKKNVFVSSVSLLDPL